jgi:hypothetical protein
LEAHGRYSFGVPELRPLNTFGITLSRTKSEHRAQDLGFGRSPINSFANHPVVALLGNTCIVSSSSHSGAAIMTDSRMAETLWGSSTRVARFNLFLCIIGLAGIATFLILQGAFRETFALEFFIIVALYIITEKVQALLSARSEDKLCRDIVDLTSSKVEVRCIGTHVEGLQYCTEKMKMVKRFQDTYFRTEADKTNKSHPMVTERFYAAVLDMLARGGSFDCLISIHNMPVYKQLVANIRQRSIENRSHLRLFVRTLDHGDLPLINTQILTYLDDTREVVFGWNFRNADDGLVFSSKEEKIVRYFAGYYEEIRSKCVAVFRSLA